MTKMVAKQRRFIRTAAITICTLRLLDMIRYQNTWSRKYYWQQIVPKQEIFTPTQQQSASSHQPNRLLSASPRTELLFPYYIIDDKNTINNNTDAFVGPGIEHRHKEAEICFIKSSYAKSVDHVDRVDDPSFNVTEFRDLHPLLRFYMFTNLKELQPPGWTTILTPNLPYKRFITHSRYGKFLAWLLPEIQECGVVFYMDSNVAFHTKSTIPYRKFSRRILQSPLGLMQFKHPYSTPGGGRPGWETYGPLDELNYVVESKKDIAKNVNASVQWLNAQEDFDNDHTPVYANTYFGYNPKNPHYQALSLKFWERYSLELDSWRDQPLWSYMVKKQNMTPILFPNHHATIFKTDHRLKGHGGHKYSEKNNEDTVDVSS